MYKRRIRIFIALLFQLNLFPYLLLSQSIDSIKISGSYKKVALSSIFQDLEKKYKLKFYYKNEWFDKDTVSLEFDNASVFYTLDKILSAKSFLYQVIQNNLIAILPKDEFAAIMGQDYAYKDISDESTILIGNPLETGKYKKVEIKGKIKDGKTGEPLIGSNIVIENTTQGTVSNAEGKYSLTISPGIYNIIISNIGYEASTYKVKVVSNGTLDAELFVKSLKIDEINIYAQRPDRNVRNNQMSMLEMDSKTIKQLPSMVGEKDILKSLTLLPGVKSVGEFGSGINVRGGGEDQNLYLIEGTPVFNTSHVFGLISAFNPDVVNNVTLYKGHIPANFGERVSSVMDIQVKDNNCKTLMSKGGIGLYDSRLMVEGPLFNNSLTFKFGGRSSYSNWLLKQLPDYYLQNSFASFYDFNGLINWTYKNHRISLFGYNSYDKFRYANIQSYEYSNKMGSLNWNYNFNRDLSSSFLASFSQYNVNLDYLNTGSENRRIASRINYVSGKYNLKYTGFLHQNIIGGIQAIHYQITPGIQTPLDSMSLILPVSLQKEYSLETGLYLNDLYEINDHFSLNLGLRYSRYYYLGPHEIYNYQDGTSVSIVSVLDTVEFKSGKIIKSYSGIEPRLSFKIQFDNKSSLKISYNRNNQYIFLLSYTSVSTPNDIWKLSDPFLKPLTADQFAIGYYRNFLDNSIETSIELYYKNLANLVEYKNDAKIEMNDHLETQLINATGKNYGIELFIKKNKGKLDGWISYTYSRSLKKTDGIFSDEIINDNNYYPSSYDKPHDLTLVANYHLNKRWRVGGNFSFASGRAITLPEYQYYDANQQLIYYSDRNKYRLPPYHRLDISVSLDESLKIKKRWKGSWTFSVINLYGRKNIYSVFYKKETPSSVNNYKQFSLYKLYIIGRPLPTLTYNFIF